MARWDQLHSFILDRSWTGVMVEPVAYLCDQIRRNYGSTDRVAVENAAISNGDDREPFYQLEAVEDPESQGLPDWYDAIGSLDRDQVMTHRDLIPDLEKRIVSTDVACLTFDSLCRKHGLEDIDFLMVDTEGHDWAILQSIDFNAHHPRLIVYEHQHLADEDRAACRARLESNGYRTQEEWWDTGVCMRAPIRDCTRSGIGFDGRWRGVSASEPREAIMAVWKA